MPYYEMDEGLADEYGLEGGVHYEPAEAQVDFDQLGGGALAARAVLREKGFTTIEGHYDGGFDEGFAYFDAASAGDQRLTADELGALLAEGPLGDGDAMIARMLAAYPNAPEGYQAYLRESAEQASRAERVTRTLEELADAIATELLGAGYGTGEVSLRGRFLANLETGQVLDLEDD